jgi:heme exporter protein D
LCSLFYVDLSHSSAMASLKVMEQWIETLVARKRSLRGIIAQRLREALQTTPEVFEFSATPGLPLPAQNPSENQGRHDRRV